MHKEVDNQIKHSNQLVPKKQHRIIPYIIIVLVLILCFASFLAYKNSGSEMLRAEDGVLNLTGWDIEQDGSVELDGQWEFYWEEFVPYEDLDSPEVLKKRIFVNVPDSWDNYINGSESFPSFGYATYRIKVIKGDNTLDGIKLGTTYTASKLIINGKEYMSSGTVGTDAESATPAKTPVIVRVDESSEELDIILYVSNFSEGKGGIGEGISIGTYEQLEQADRMQMIKDAFLLGSLFIISIYYLSIFLLRRDSKESLYICIGCLLIIAKLLVYDSYFISRIYPDFNYMLSIFLFHITEYWGVFTLLAFILCFYPNKAAKKIIKIHFTVAAAFTIFAIATPIYIYTATTPVFDVVNLAALIYLLIIVSKAAYNGLFGARIIMFGASAMDISIIHDTLKYSNIIDSPFDALTALGAVIMIVFLALVFSLKLAQEHTQLKLFAEKLDSANKLKDEFLTNTSHELRTPINAMIAITESIVKDENADVGEREKNDLLHVISSGRRLVSLVNDILDYSRLKHGELPLVKTVFNIDKLTQGIVREFSFVAMDKNIGINYQSTEGLPAVYADEYRITQVLYNIIGNAVKFTNKGGKIMVSAFSDEDTVYIMVADDGIGIPEDKADDIFETFQQSDASITRKYGGMGLGLSISREIITAHNRKIRVRSHPGEGSEFVFGVPLAIPDTSDEANKIESRYAYLTDAMIQQKSELTAKGIKKGNIVVIDDNYANLIGVINILRADGYTVKGFTNPHDALAQIFKGPEVAAAVVDVMMPELSGFEVCRKIRERFSLFELPVLMLTANTAIESMVEGFESGANDFIKKPFDGDELKARVKTLYNLKFSAERAISSETAFLQAQIKPHFLYNTINAIIASCHTNSEQAADMLLDLSDYLRHLFDFESEERLIPLDREMEAVKAYLSLEKARFIDGLEYDIDMSGQKNILIPPMIIQPIVENAVRHGLRKVDRRGNIIIKGRKNEGFYTITVEDNGAGIAEGDLQKIMRGKKKEGGGTGLANTRKRLNYFYGTDIQIESTYGTGTKVAVTVKVKEEEDAQGYVD